MVFTLRRTLIQIVTSCCIIHPVILVNHHFSYTVIPVCFKISSNFFQKNIRWLKWRFSLDSMEIALERLDLKTLCCGNVSLDLICCYFKGFMSIIVRTLLHVNQSLILSNKSSLLIEIWKIKFQSKSNNLSNYFRVLNNI